jgi:hypothetical protein
LDYVHREANGAGIYFIRNSRPQPLDTVVTLRSSALAPELWHADTGRTAAAAAYDLTTDGRTRVPLSLEPNGSIFVVFRRPAGAHTSIAAVRPAPAPRETPVSGPWTVRFTPGWGAPESAVFQQLKSWSEVEDPGIRYFSGSATYSMSLQLSSAQLDAVLDLGDVREIAQVRLNGQDLGIAWKRPFTVSLRPAAKTGPNQLEITVTNLWPNRLIGDQLLPPEKRYTHTNIAKFRADSPLMPSGLLGPVRLLTKAGR